MKRVFCVLLSLPMLLSLVACGNGDGTDTLVADLERQIQELEEENANLKAQLENYGVIVGEDGIAVEPETPETQKIEIGAVSTIPELCEFTVDYAELKKEVLPPNPDSYYSYYQEKDGMTYLDVAISVKNLRTTARTASDFGSVKAIVGSGYEYNGFSVIEEPGGVDFTYTNITNVDPLETAVIHYLISIPNELADDAAAGIILEITMLDNDYTLTAR